MDKKSFVHNQLQQAARAREASPTFQLAIQDVHDDIVAMYDAPPKLKPVLILADEIPSNAMTIETVERDRRHPEQVYGVCILNEDGSAYCDFDVICRATIKKKKLRKIEPLPPDRYAWFEQGVWFIDQRSKSTIAG